MSLNNLRGYWKPPWTVSGPGVLQPDRPTLLTVGGEDFGFIEVVRLHDEASQRKIANAIAALPELIAALESLSGWSLDAHWYEITKDLASIIDDANAAIAKAQGGEASGQR